MKVSKLLPFIMTMLLLEKHLVNAFNPLFRFENVAELNNKNCEDSEMVFTQNFLGYGKLGLSLCSTMCIGYVNCTSIFYNADTAICTGCNGNYNVSSLLANYAGTEYFKRMAKFYHDRCQLGDHCIEPNQECYGDMCVCSPGYSYNPSNKSCVTECEKYGTTFQSYPRHRLYDDNMYVKKHGTLNECLQECISNAQCVSVDYGHSTSNLACNVQDNTPLTSTSYLEEIDKYDYYVRNCD